MQAMLRVAFRLGASLETAFTQVNNQLADTLPDDRFITAFIGLLDVQSHRLRFHSGGQGPILHYQAATGACARHKPTSFPLAAMPLTTLRPAVTLEMQPGDVLVLLSDGIYEYASADGEEFGEARVREVVAARHAGTAEALCEALLAAVKAFAKGAPQEDDMTLVLVRREAAP
jgi:phosphoserine phosphatase